MITTPCGYCGADLSRVVINHRTVWAHSSVNADTCPLLRKASA